MAFEQRKDKRKHKVTTQATEETVDTHHVSTKQGSQPCDLFPQFPNKSHICILGKQITELTMYAEVIELSWLLRIKNDPRSINAVPSH